MSPEQTTKTILRLKTYAELCQQRLQGESDAEKKAFFERDLKKTLAAVARLQK